MNLTRLALAVAGLSFAAVSAAADTSGVAASSEAKKENRLVCFAEKTTGSQLRKRICMTREEQEQRRKEDQDAMNKLRRSGATANRDPKL